MAKYGSNEHNTEEIGHIWERFVPVEEAVKEQSNTLPDIQEKLKALDAKVKQPSENAIEAAEAAKDTKTCFNSARTYRGQITKIKNQVSMSLEDVVKYHSGIEDIHNKVKEALEEIAGDQQFAEEKRIAIAESVIKCNSLESEFQQTVEKIKSILEDNYSLDDDVSNARELLDGVTEIESKASTSLKSIVSTHGEINNFKRELLGYHEKDQYGEQHFIGGLKNELENSYDQIELKIKKANTDIDNATKLATKESQKFIDEKKKEYAAIHNEIKGLLPSALTAGLSTAYNDKIESEQIVLENLEGSFRKAIGGLVAISLIPFAIDIWLLCFSNSDLLQVVQDTPKIIFSILPLYFPVFWMAYSASKKINLSKRLIEEYTHKGVLSKTYEGLSRQVSDLEDSDESNVLMTKLLSNLLQVNSENPGKLISDYNTADHPVVDVLEKSMKLNDSIEVASKVPGLASLAVKLQKRQEKITEKKSKMVEDGLDHIVDEET